MTAYCNFDLGQHRGFGLGGAAETLMIALPVYKIRRFLAEGLRLRTACDLRVSDVAVTAPEGVALTELPDIESALPGLIQAVAKEGRFSDPPVTTVTWRS